MLGSQDHICTDIIGVFKIDRQKYVNIRSHPRSYDIISVRLSGTGHFSTKKEDFSISEGDVLYIPRNAEYTQRSERESIIAVHFLNYGAADDGYIKRFSPADKKTVISLFQRLYREWEKEAFGNRYRCYAILYEILYCLQAISEPESLGKANEKSRLAPAIQYIHENYRSQSIEISELAKLCNLSEPYFRKLFKSAYHASPVDYITNLRLDFASHLLKSGLYNVSEAAERAGYKDQKYFSRRFKARFGVSPKKYV